MKDLLVALGTVVLTVVVHTLKSQPAQPQNPPAVIATTPASPTAVPPAVKAPVRTAKPAKMPASVAHATQVIDIYVKKHPTAKSTASLRRLSAAAKARPEKSGALAEATAYRITHAPPLTPKEEVMLEEAALLAEREGLTPQEMSEFMRKWERDQHLNPRTAAKPETAHPVAMPSFDGKLHLVYRFVGSVHCGKPSCADIPVNLRVSAGAWVETREGKTDKNGHYSLELPILATDGQKIAWRLQAYTQDLRQTELSGQRQVTRTSRDVTLSNDLNLSSK
jgi:hypothetical protein